MSYLIMFEFLVIIAVLGAVIGYIWGSMWFGLIIALVAALIYIAIVFSSGDMLVLTMSRAKPVTKQDYPYLYHTLEGLVIAAGLKKKPKLYIIEDSALNAFATGKNPDNSYIVVTKGLVDRLNRQELEGVLAHELSHIRNYDIRVMMLAAVLVGVVVLISDLILRSFFWGGGRKDREDRGNAVILFIAILLALLAPLFAQLIRLAVSRRREFLADASAAMLTRYPEGLASALEKIKKDPKPLMKTANRAMAHLYIANPFRKTRGFLTNLFSTHPPIEERIKKLRAM